MNMKDTYIDALELASAQQGLDRQFDDHIRRLNESLSSWAQGAKALEAMSSISRVVKDLNRQHEALRTILGPMEDWRRSHLLEMPKPLKNIVEGMQAFKEYEARFTLPPIDLYPDLVKQIEKSRLDIPSDMLMKTAAEMQKPWLDIERLAQSFAGFAELQNIGYAMDHYRPFEPRLSEILRTDLGDWRDKIAWTKVPFDDLEQRSEFYIARGFKRELTDLPAPAFAENLEIAGLFDNPPLLIERYYGPPVPIPMDMDEVLILGRSSKVYGWLRALETHLRNFIDRAMTEVFGQDWPRHRLPNGLYEQWMNKKAKAERVGSTEYPIICYADFTDYELIILKSDNWKSVFADFFVRPESVRESLQRLYLPRVATMHARPITQDDELFVYVEVKRLMKAFASFTDFTD